ncbi:MAG: iron-sulfur cluster carrier protein ApbC [Sulfobacillus thermosulfidooxidans]|uniref:Iron-sulfur cluster carrier protein n=1 Tax=Sulfobacillus thermotolerans TaxID=338644 RepID=A0ABM6RTM5_9FIRM|nr:Mrp/NBP35 family ATP-binding protein [Sulfobacillus sp. hq2]AUW94794.1 chromosome partitioning protein ParA [Sulfobacillus thermotolerans]MCY0906837.1 Mrp/NBP35 family ATP-binding protein [Sulfobacillus thermotolerans]POB09803.1 chromosome partitioning protein ParA [Sulfobacillus sp. hq2]PSR33478.1 MAG: iron-sulfur cluster carrier protein ApbC [Sulfobacillus thermosulfidooxidans]
MLDQARVLEALEEVQDPELRQSIVTLNMVRTIDIKPNGVVSLDIALTVDGCPLHEKITADVKHSLGRLPEVKDISVTLSVMNEQERRVAFQKAFEAAQQARQGEPARSEGGTRINVTPPPPKSSGKAPLIGPLPGQGAASGMMSDADSTIIIGVASGKGGVGKSTVTANLAVALARMGSRVGVIDMDIYGFSQGRMFGAKEKAKVNEQEKIIPWSMHGVHVVSMGMFVEEGQAIVWRGPMLGKMMQQFFSDVAWPTLDYLLIDLPPGTGDVALDMAQKVRKAKLVLVTTPQQVATQVAHRAGDVAQKAHQEIIGVIENMSYVVCPHGERMNVFGEGGGQSLADLFHVPLLGQIPLESTVREGGDKGRPLAASEPTSPAGAVFLSIAERIKQTLSNEAAG